MKKTYKILIGIYFGFLALGIALWIKKNFGTQITFDQIMFHLVIGIDANDGANALDSSSLLRYILVWPLVLTSVSSVVAFVIEKYFYASRDNVLSVISVLAIAAAIFNLNLYQFAASFIGEDVFSRLYVTPDIRYYKEPAKKRNIVLIYVESLEYGIRNQGHFNPLAPIDAIDGLSINKFHQAPGTGWSIAGMVASQCSLPLKPFYGNNVSKFATNKFLPHAICLGDVLNHFGYHQIFMVGPDLKFAGMDKFYSSHKFDEIYGRDELKGMQKINSEFKGWGGGANDDVLLEMAFEVIKPLKGNNKPFNLTIITTDNHAPNGIPSPNCKEEEIKAGYLGTFTCTSKFVAKFINQIMMDKDLNDTDIVVMGDHLFMANSQQVKAFPKDRYIYFKYITRNYRSDFGQLEMTHFDVAPTILNGLGIIDHQKRFGLGRSLFSNEIDTKYLSERIDPKILNKSEKYDAFW